MQQEESHTEVDINQEESDQEEEDMEFGTSPDKNQPISFLVCLAITITILLLGLLKIAVVLSTQYPVVSIAQDQEYFKREEISEREAFQSSISPDILVDSLESTYRQVSIEQVGQQDIIDVEHLNQYHVQFKRALRSLDYSNAKIQLADFLDDPISRHSEITYGQFLAALNWLRLTTLPANDFSEQFQALQQQQYRTYNQKWRLWDAEQSICSVLLLSQQGLNTGSYYYAIRGLFQQKYSKLKIVVVDDTPELGLQAKVVGLLKELSDGRDLTLVDKIRGQGSESSSIYYAVHKYCKDTSYTVILRDNGQLIGQYAFALLNKIHQRKGAPLVMSHYLLDSGNLYSNLKDGFRYKVQLYPKYQTPAEPRNQDYKTKFIKSYQTRLLLSLPLSSFQNSHGFWLPEKIDAYLQFAALERACGQHFILDEILYRVPKSQLDNLNTVVQARHVEKATCQDQEGSSVKEDSWHLQLRKFKENLIPIDHVQGLKDVDYGQLQQDLTLFNSKRKKGLKMMVDNQLRIAELKSQVENNFGGITNTALIACFQNMKSYRLPFGNQSTIETSTFSQFNSDTQLTTSQKQLQRHSIERQQKKTQFCVILLTDNNYPRFQYFYSMQSVLQQEYGFYRLVLLDNASDDHTMQGINHQLKFVPQDLRSKIYIYTAKTKRPKSELIYFGARKFCQAHEVMIMMEGGDELIGKFVFERLNEKYSSSNILAAYSNSIHYEEQRYLVGNSRAYDKEIISDRKFRQSPLLFGPLRSFKASLFQQLKEDDFKVDGKWDQEQLYFNISYGIMEMACEKIVYLNEILYQAKTRQKDFPSFKESSVPLPIPSIAPENTPTISADATKDNPPSALRSAQFIPRYNCLSLKHLTTSP